MMQRTLFTFLLFCLVLASSPLIAQIGADISDPEPLNANAATDSGSDFNPRFATDGSGNWVAVWVSMETFSGTLGSDHDVLVARSTDNGVTWTDPEPVNNAATDSGLDLWPEVITDGSGN